MITHYDLDSSNNNKTMFCRKAVGDNTFFIALSKAA
jgi:hypothetical protein